MSRPRTDIVRHADPRWSLMISPRSPERRDSSESSRTGRAHVNPTGLVAQCKIERVSPLSRPGTSPVSGQFTHRDQLED